MKSSRRGFLAALLAMIPFARSAEARAAKSATIRIFNASPFPAAGIVATSITAASPQNLINSGSYADFKGVPGSATAVSVVDNNTGEYVQATLTTFPGRGQIKQFNFNMTTTDNVNYVLVFPSAGSAT